MAIHNREDLHPFTQARGTDLGAHRLWPQQRGIQKHSRSSSAPSSAQRIGQLYENLAQDLAFAPPLTSAMHRCVVG
jgi:hypothetical protein